MASKDKDGLDKKISVEEAKLRLRVLSSTFAFDKNTVPAYIVQRVRKRPRETLLLGLAVGGLLGFSKTIRKVTFSSLIEQFEKLVTK